MKTVFLSKMPEVQYAQMLITMARGRAEAARRDGRNEIGASAIEWAIISAIVVALAVLIGNAIQNVVESRSSEIDQGS